MQVRSRLLASGLTDGEVRRRRRTGALVPIRRGAYLAPDDPRLRRPAERHRLLVAATVPHLAPGSVISHASAAVLHGLPVWSLALDRVHVTRSDSASGHRSSTVHRHAAPLEREEIVLLDGIAVTSPARTAIDVARTAGFEQAVIVLDGVLFRELTDPAGLTAALLRATRWLGSPQARRAVAFADAGAQSAGESRSRVAMQLAGLPAPVLQWPVRTGRGVVHADFGWPGLRTVGEFDGAIKYGALVRTGETPADVVIAEKLREDALREEGLRVVRWGWNDLDAFDAVAHRLRRAFRPA